jgi:acyl-coenzyme A thioesterase PaaI-like protein
MLEPEVLSFDAATALRPGGRPGVFDVDVHPSWSVDGNPNGGYLLALLGRAARSVVRSSGRDDWEAQAASVTYVRPPALRTATLRTSVLREGRSAAHVRAVLSQDDADLVDAVFVLAALGDGGAPPRYDATLPFDAPGPDDCVRVPSRMPNGFEVPINKVNDLRLDPATLPFAESPPPAGAAAEIRGWTRFADGREADPLSLLFSIDAIPPPTLVIGSTGWVPTLQMSVYVRGRPAPGWLGIRITANVVAVGTVDETCILWDSRNRVVAQATQLARLRFPDELG